MASPSTADKLLIVSVTPYFLEKGNVWFQENFEKILRAQKTQAFFQDNVVSIEVGAELGLSQLLRKLDELGYEKVFRVSEPGEFAHRGGIVEVFPINMNTPVQIEFKGNTIEYFHAIAGRNYTSEEERKIKELLKKRLKSQSASWRTDLHGLKSGDYIVHLDHGVALFGGIEDIQSQQYYALEYAAGDKLFVPIGLERKLSRYVGFSEPHIPRLGSLTWQKTKKKAKEEIEKLAKELLELYAKREISLRPPYRREEEIEQKLKETFSYEETPDQMQALEDIYKDLAAPEPMDRIVCGDVGFGKTEVALRSMVRAAHNGYQAALLAPTTILVDQHYKNFASRLKNLPIRLAALSRLQSKKEQAKILRELKEGQVDIVVGTHRLLSNDVNFKNLGLLVIDDEQRFGVKQKEKFKEMRSSLDVLSLSATPIPRTLYMALSSLKKISSIQTPPEGRLPVQTTIIKRNENIVKEAIQKELARGGQVYYLHNRIGTIEQVKKHLEKLVPEVYPERSRRASFAIAHGRMRESQLIKVIEDFRNKNFDVLLATTIIENGLDMANVSTIIVDDAPKLGLSQAYQIKGRVGRSNIQSYAYFLYGGRLGEKAKLRLRALKEAEELGSGYKIALRDLEIRGAGNILGKEQAGTVNTIGLNLYCQMLSESVERLRNN